MVNDEVLMEYEAVKAVYADLVEEPPEGFAASHSFKIQIFPDTGGNETSKFSGLKISFLLVDGYPSVPPKIHFEHVFGVSSKEAEELLNEMIRQSETSSADSFGSLFEVINIAKEFANSHNVPTDDCMVCLEPFNQTDTNSTEGETSDAQSYLRIPCGHAFHCACLAHWMHDQLAVRRENKIGEAADADEGEDCEEASEEEA
eukprot:CAMPEP_0113693280 /NCGR_PEP_ID=MMETSP0038_2-20120614/19573_1 /TAXON_ID=2898 /ORGANISM="Cryptomonas paramecium" /LENGTH=201 /DNA_ID=CAMNT_0000615327 /DNA_START=136 /DNA_END=738 /DNA_ORIENTATION=- /assembly_acc=CAM_ASM_000170